MRISKIVDFIDYLKQQAINIVGSILITIYSVIGAVAALDHVSTVASSFMAVKSLEVTHLRIADWIAANIPEKSAIITNTMPARDIILRTSNRGNKFEYLTSTATKSRGLHKYIVDLGGEDHPNASVDFRLGDIVTTVIKCYNGESVVVSHDTSSPRPYSLNFRVQGTGGIWMSDNYSIYLEGKSPKPHEWEPFDEYQKKYDHSLWKSFENDADGAGHGGIDFFIVRAFIESVKRKVKPPIDVYDAVSMSVISPLSEKSISNGSSPVEFPDFTRGKWRRNKPIFGVSDL